LGVAGCGDARDRAHSGGLFVIGQFDDHDRRFEQHHDIDWPYQSAVFE